MAKRFRIVAAVLVGLGVVGQLTASPVGGIFETTPLLNAWHVLAGCAAAVASWRGLGTMRLWGQLLGYVFAAMTIAGFAADAAAVGGWLPLSDANAWWHLALTLFFLYHALLAPPTI